MDGCATNSAGRTAAEGEIVDPRAEGCLRSRRPVLHEERGRALHMISGSKAPAEIACPICANKRNELFQARLLHKYDVRYFLCKSCGLLQTEPAYWLDEAYSSAIADTDTGIVSRNQEIANKLASLLYFCFDPKAQYLESAGGYGLLTRMMRDWGFDFRWHDPYCENVFARGFEWDPTRGSASGGAVTAFQ